MNPVKRNSGTGREFLQLRGRQISELALDVPQVIE
jgi:hypothetical protein